MASNELIPDALWAGHLDAHSHSFQQSKLGEPLCPTTFVTTGPLTNYGADYCELEIIWKKHATLGGRVTHFVTWDGYESPTTLNRTHSQDFTSPGSDATWSISPLQGSHASVWWPKRGQWDIDIDITIDSRCHNAQGGIVDPNDQTKYYLVIKGVPRRTFSSVLDQYGRRIMFHSGDFSSGSLQSFSHSFRIINTCWWDIRLQIGIANDPTTFAAGETMATLTAVATRR